MQAIVRVNVVSQQFFICVKYNGYYLNKIINTDAFVWMKEYTKNTIQNYSIIMIDNQSTMNNNMMYKYGRNNI